MSRRADRVNRPLKRAEYEIRFATREAEKGWTDLLATTRGAVVDAWDYLTATPLLQTERHSPMRADSVRSQRCPIYALAIPPKWATHTTLRYEA